MTVADGFEASYEVVDAGDKIVKLTIKNNGSNLAGEQALVSMPIRTWELNNSNKKAALTEKEWTYAEFKATKEFWPVATEVRIQQGEVNYTDGAKDSFTGENVFVWSESWANYANMTKTQEGKDYYNAWNGGHIHNTTVTKEAKAATCTEDGWTEETFCEECNSVVNWSETVPATGHDFELDLEQGKIICKTCGAVNTDYTGLIEKDGKYYYAKIGVLSGGWVDIDEEWYYFDEETKEAVPTLDNGFVTYEFEANGKLVSGKWYKDSNGIKYYYGPDFYHAKTVYNLAYDLFAEIDGKTYCFNYNGYRYGKGIHKLWESNAQQFLYGEFGDDGVFIGNANGLYNTKGETYYLVDGYTVPYYGLVEVDGSYYYVNDGGRVVKDNDKYINKDNGLLVNGKSVAKTTQHFDTDGRMVINQDVKNGLIGDYYYENGYTVPYKGLIESDGNYYYVNDGGKIVKDTDKYINTDNGLRPGGKNIGKTTQHFDADGHLVYETAKNGLIGDYYYENGYAVPYKGLIEVDGDYYYVNDGGKIVKDMDKYVNTDNGLRPGGKNIGKTTQHFDADGRLVFEAVKNGLIGDYYYENGYTVPYKGLVYSDGYYYYVNDGGKIVKDVKKFVNTDNGLKPEGQSIGKTYQYFDVAGHLVLE